MRFSSPLLYDLARSQDTPQLDVTDARLYVPPIMHPVASVPISFRQGGAFSPVEQQRQSFISGVAAFFRAASQPTVSQDVCTFFSGLWRLRISYTVLSDRKELVGDGTTADAVFLQGPNGNSVHAMVGTRTAGGLFREEWDHTVLLVERGWKVVLQVGLTAVGETAIAKVTVAASRLL